MTASFTPTERALFGTLAVLLVASCAAILIQINQFLLVEVPGYGGTYTEGVVGTPRFINPLLAVSGADQDLTELIYAGLLRPTAEGTLVKALAADYQISEDGLSYTVTLRPDATFHDGTPVTAEDVVFTILRAQDPMLKSPQRANWDGVTAEKLDELTVRFTLSQPYAPFLENLTLGILPKHLWQSVSPEQFPFSQFNTEPVGAGPYGLSRVTRSSAGLPQTYTLTAFKYYALGEPHIAKIVLRFHQSEDELVTALRGGTIDAVSGLSPQNLARVESAGVSIETAALPRVFGVFFNQNVAPAFASAAVRKALSLSVDRGAIIEAVLGGYGKPVAGPIPPGILGSLGAADESGETLEERLARARALLERDGWTLSEEGLWQKTVKKETQELRFSLSTANTPELARTAELLIAQWAALSVPVELKLFDTGDLNQNVIRPRRYDALFFGEIVGRELDLFSFWHSSQRNDPGLNIALYTSITADDLLEEARTTSSGKRLEILSALEDEIESDAPAVFVYAPELIYAIPKKISGVKLGPLTTPAERFADVHNWYLESERVWPIFERFSQSRFAR